MNQIVNTSCHSCKENKDKKKSLTRPLHISFYIALFFRKFNKKKGKRNPGLCAPKINYRKGAKHC